jgi:hypothetical protein
MSIESDYVTIELPRILWNDIKRDAERKMLIERYEERGKEFIPSDHFGSNSDDCYDGGLEDGRIETSQHIVENARVIKE